ncbi:MAG: hypothetical protein H7Y03_07545 [Chitinophagaceae bacterium]|nr:hypothetical protein [Chitinophagaceae bacterium]
MSKTTLSSIGGLQSFFFCIGMYFVALFFSIFICSSVFYAIHPKKEAEREAVAGAKQTPQEKKVYASVK